MLSSDQIRQKFIDYFTDKQHIYQSSSSLVPEDKTVLLTIAGMLPFKPYFLGTKETPFSRATSVQKCIRTNDLENVGITPRHHTFFEMLGNFSFGDYFKKEAITFAWDLLTNHYGLAKDKLYISVFEEDDEALKLWLSQTDVQNSHIVKLGKDSNFWESGPTGPCGPCSEIYYDYGEEHGCKEPNCAVGCNCSRYVEIWNLVFMQYNRGQDGNLTTLPKLNIDTGMGLERITAVLQGVNSNFHTDLFTPIIKAINNLATTNVQASVQVIADHVRAVVFMIADGIYPGNDGRGYILKKIIRRTVRHGKLLGIKASFMGSLAQILINQYGHFYPELTQKADLINEIIITEENNFSKTLENGLQLIEELIIANNKITSEDAFKLFDTYGFPLELTTEIAKEKNIEIDTSSFDNLMEEQKNRARNSAVFYKDEKDKPKGGEAIVAKSEDEKMAMAKHHSATHLLQATLRQVLGKHVTQAGSMVSPERLRFDFTHPKALSQQDILDIELLINHEIQANTEVNITQKDYKEALSEGAMALFTEKYNDVVRVVKMGNFSIELCGGTHVARTGDIGLLKIISETSISSGIRRIEAIVGEVAIKYIQNQTSILANINSHLKCTIHDTYEKVINLTNDNSALKKEIEILVNTLNANELAELIIKERFFLHNIPLAIINTSKPLPNNPKDIYDRITNDKAEFIAHIVTNAKDNTASIYVKISSNIINKYQLNAGNIVKEATAIINGRGGGKSDFAQGAGKDMSKINDLISFLQNTIRLAIKD